MTRDRAFWQLNFRNKTATFEQLFCVLQTGLLWKFSTFAVNSLELNLINKFRQRIARKYESVVSYRTKPPRTHLANIEFNSMFTTNYYRELSLIYNSSANFLHSMSSPCGVLNGRDFKKAEKDNKRKTAALQIIDIKFSFIICFYCVPATFLRVLYVKEEREKVLRTINQFQFYKNWSYKRRWHPAALYLISLLFSIKRQSGSFGIGDFVAAQFRDEDMVGAVLWKSYL